MQVEQRGGSRQLFQTLLDSVIVAPTAILQNLTPSGPFHVFLNLRRVFVAQLPLLIKPIKSLREQPVFLLEPAQSGLGLKDVSQQILGCDCFTRHRAPPMLFYHISRCAPHLEGAAAHCYRLPITPPNVSHAGQPPPGRMMA